MSSLFARLENPHKSNNRADSYRTPLPHPEISLGTSKINYIDPRISVKWCKEHDVPLNKIFSKTLLEKFTWAVNSVEADFDW